METPDEYLMLPILVLCRLLTRFTSQPETCITTGSRIHYNDSEVFVQCPNSRKKFVICRKPPGASSDTVPSVTRCNWQCSQTPAWVVDGTRKAIRSAPNDRGAREPGILYFSHNGEQVFFHSTDTESSIPILAWTGPDVTLGTVSFLHFSKKKKFLKLNLYFIFI